MKAIHLFAILLATLAASFFSACALGDTFGSSPETQLPDRV